MSDLVKIYRGASTPAGETAKDGKDDAWAPTATELNEICLRVAARYPDVSLGRERFVAKLGERGAKPSGPEGEAELFLACAAVAGCRVALRRLSSDYLDAALEAVRHMHLPASVADDVKQKTSEKLLLASDGAVPKIVRYAGQGKLRGLVKVVATRTALSELRKVKNEVAIPDAGPDIFEAPSETDAELAFVKERYRAEFKQAFERAVDDLTERERNLLRLHLLRGVTLAALADIYSVHRATVTRWLATARAKLLKKTRARLGEQLELGSKEIESVMGWIGSRLDASVSRVLRTRAEPLENKNEA